MRGGPVKHAPNMVEVSIEEMKDLIEKAKSLQEEIQSLEITESDIKKSHHLRKRIDSLDWKIQTTPTMGIAEERQLTEQVNALMAQLGEISVSAEKLKARKEINREIKKNNLVITADARLDNRESLCALLDISHPEWSIITDSQLIFYSYST